MQTDVWLTEADHQDRCPMCSASIKPGTETCFACGFSSHPTQFSPVSSVWIDPAAREYQQVMPAQANGGAPAPHLADVPTATLSTRQRRRPPNPMTPLPPRFALERQQLRHRTEDLSEHAQVSAIWQYESTNYEVASSLPSLSLIAPEFPTQPQPPLAPRLTRRLPAIDDIDTVPSVLLPSSQAPSASRAVVPLGLAAQESTLRSLVPAQQPHLSETQDAASWTAGAASNSMYAHIIAGTERGDRRKRSASRNPLDRLRWWLLRPGHIESSLWLSGTLLLILVTGCLLFALAFSIEGGVPTTSSSTSNSSAAKARGQTTVASLRMTLTQPEPYTPGELIGVSGQGFSGHNRVSFTLDGLYPIEDQNGNPAQFPTSATGTFNGTLWLGIDAHWTAGSHSIVARDMATGRHTAEHIMLVVSTTSVLPTAQVSTTPGVTPTTVPTLTTTATPTPQATSGNKTPVPTPSPTITPTTRISPTPTKTATPTKTPSASPTATHTSGLVVNNSSLGNDINQSGDPPIGGSLSTASPLVWIMAACYSLSMILLGVAGVLYKRRPRQVRAVSSR